MYFNVHLWAIFIYESTDNNNRMNRKLMISSIAVAVIIVLISFTSVIGFQTTKSKLIKDSPLFNVRTQRAINKPSKDVMITEYIGKRKTITISFPTKNTTLLLLQKVIDGISTMKDIVFSKFLNETISKLHESKIVKEKDLTTIKQLFHFLRDHPEEAKKYPFDLKKHSYTIGCPPPTFVNTPKECFKFAIYFAILVVTFPIWFPIYMTYIFYLTLTHGVGCLTYSPTCK